MSVTDKLQALSKTELKIVRETAVTNTTTKTTTPTAPVAAPASIETLLNELETAKRRSSN